MKKVFVVLVAGLVLFSGLSVAHAGKSNQGCGVGTMIFEGKDSLLFDVLAVTTNGTFANQTFGITSGTLGCERPVNWASNEKLQEFVAYNMDSLAQDIAAGEGESIATLAELMEVPAAERPEFYFLLQANFSRIFSSDDVTSASVIDNIASIATSS